MFENVGEKWTKNRAVRTIEEWKRRVKGSGDKEARCYHYDSDSGH